MPIHDYQCQRCKRRSELLVMPGQKPACPDCGSVDMLQLFSATASVSTSRSRERSAARVRSKVGAVKKEKDAAHAEYLRKHNEDH